MFSVLLFLYIFDQLKLYNFLPESVFVLFLGILIGIFVRFVTPSIISTKILQMNSQIFFKILLPVIIFDAGYNLSRGDFFGNIVN